MPPALVQDFDASDGGDSQSTLTWTNPPNSDLREVVVCRKMGTYPSSHTDGDPIYVDTAPIPGATVEYVDTGLTNGVTYYYAVFSREITDGWPGNHPPDPPTALVQLLPDGTEIPVGGEVDTDTVVFKAIVTDPNGDRGKLQVELRRLDELGGGFNETQSGLKSEFVASGEQATCSASGLIPADYHWRARAIDEHGLAGEWMEFGNNPTSATDFTVQAVTDTTPPALVQDFSASDGEDGKSTLGWTNPPDEDLAEVLVRRKTDGYPSDHTDGDLVYQDISPTPGAPVEYIDTGLVNGTTYYYAVFSRDNAGNWNDQVVEGKNADTATPGLENRAPIARASDISGQPGTMYPGVSYTVTAKYFEPDGREDLKYCYLRLDHPEKPLTMMWYQEDGHAAPWAGEEGENYLTRVEATATEIVGPETGYEGYEIAWTFEINDSWPEVENAIDFGVSAIDDSDISSSWVYDDTAVSFYWDSGPIEALAEEIDRLVAGCLLLLQQLPSSVIENAKNWAYFSNCIEKDALDAVLDFGTSMFSILLTGMTDPGKLIHLKHTGAFSVIDQVRWEKEFGNILAKLSRLGLSLDDLYKGSKIVLEKFTKQEFIALARSVLSDLREHCRGTELDEEVKDRLWGQLEACVEKVETQLRGIADKAKELLSKQLSPRKARGYIEELQAIKKANEYLLSIYLNKTSLIRLIAEIREEDARDGTLMFAKLLWGTGISIFVVAAQLWSCGALLPASITAADTLRKEFYNGERIAADAHLAALAAEGFSEGFTLGNAIAANAYKVLNDIVEGKEPCVPRGKITSMYHKKIIRKWFIPPNGYYVVEEVGRSTFGVTNEEICPGGEEQIYVFYRLPYTSFRLFPGVEVTYEELLPVEQHCSVTMGISGTCEYRELPQAGSNVQVYLFAKVDGKIYGLQATTFEWPSGAIQEQEIVNEEHLRGYMGYILDNKDYSKLTVYYDETTGKIIQMPTQVIQLKSPGELCAYDQQGRVAGLVGGQVREEIPGSVYDEKSNLLVIFDASGPYIYEVKGTETGRYGLEIVKADPAGHNTFKAENMPILNEAVHKYSVDWEAISQGVEGVTIRIDNNGDGKFEEVLDGGATIVGGNTPSGHDVRVEFLDQKVRVVFSRISASGETFLSLSSKTSFNIQGLTLISQFYRFETTAEYEGPITVKLPYDDSELTPAEEARLRLFKIGDDGSLEDITTSLDKENNRATGTTHSFSSFAVGYSTGPTAVITSPSEGDAIRGKVEIIGTAAGTAFAYYTVEYGEGRSPESWNLIRRSSEPVTDGVLATWDTRGKDRDRG